MPRGVNVSRVLPILAPKKNVVPEPRKRGPKLFNAKRRIETSRGVGASSKARDRVAKDIYDERWRKIVSQDVSQFVDDMEAQGMKLLPEEKRALLYNPSKYFSRPQNVPTSLRQQVYFPNFSIQLRRTERLGPFYAQFYVPLWFSKLDLKSYLKELYDVDVNHIRSFVVYRAVTRKQARNPMTRGEIFQPRQRKRMTVQLVEPFVWPVKAEDIDKEEFGTTQANEDTRRRLEESAIENDPFGIRLDHIQRRSIAEQAKALLEGNAEWAPTWQQLPQSREVMKGIVPDKPLLPLLPSSLESKSAESWNKRWEAAFGKRRFPIEKTPREAKETNIGQ